MSEIDLKIRKNLVCRFRSRLERCYPGDKILIVCLDYEYITGYIVVSATSRKRIFLAKKHCYLEGC